MGSFQGLGGWRDEQAENKRIFRAMKHLYMILQWQIRVTMHVSKPIECITPRVKPNANFGLQMIMMC